MKYNQDHTPKKGDRILAICYGAKHRCRVISVDKDQLIYLHRIYGYFAIEISEVDFLYRCPMIFFWQR